MPAPLGSNALQKIPNKPSDFSTFFEFEDGHQPTSFRAQRWGEPT